MAVNFPIKPAKMINHLLIGCFESREVDLLCAFPINPTNTQSRHWPYNKTKTMFDIGDRVWLCHRGNHLALMPFERAGSGFEIKKNPVEGIDFKTV